MTNHVTTRGLAAAAALVATLIGGSSEALGQQATLAVPAAPAIATVATPAPALPVATPAPVAPAAPVTLDQLVEQFAGGPALDEQANCIATAVYFESMGEPLKGQLAVARVVINRAASGRYPTTYCGVVKQKAQFSFVRNGQFPRIDFGFHPIC